MNEFAVLGLVPAAFTTRRAVVAVKFFVIEEMIAAHRTQEILGVGQLDVLAEKVSEINPLPSPPVFPQIGVIGRSCAFDQDVPDNFEPTKLEQVMTGAFVAKHPAVLPFRVQLSIVPSYSPGSRFVRVRVFGVPNRSAMHPTIHRGEHFGCNAYAEVIGPTTNNRI